LKKLILMAALFALTLSTVHASAIFTGSAMGIGGTITDRITFTYSGSNLVVVLENTSTGPTGFVADELLGAFWDNSVSGVTFTPVLAIADQTIDHNNVVLGSNTNVGCNWAYKQAAFLGTSYGVGGAGYGNFGAGNVFGAPGCGNNGQPDGGDYGIVSSAGVVNTDGIPSISAFILGKLTLTFTVGGAGAAQFSESSIQNVKSTWGTQPEVVTTNDGGSTQSMPEPGTFFALGGGLVGIACLPRRKKLS